MSVKDMSYFVVIYLVIDLSDALATKQGNIGITSSGSKFISIKISQQIQVNNVSDFSISLDENSSLGNNRNLCIYSNTNIPYNITINSQNGNGDFILKNHTNKIGYSAALKNQSSNISCKNGINTTLSVDIPEDSFQAEGLVDTLTITVSST